MTPPPPDPVPGRSDPPAPAEGTRAPARARFRPAERLRASSDFRAVFARRCSVSDEFFVVYVVENRHAHARLGISVSRKVARTSVARHRIKRLVREVFRLQKPSFAAGRDFVVVARVGQLTFAQVTASLAPLAVAASRRLNATRPARDNRP